MPISLDATMMRQIIMDHYEHPRNKRTPNSPNYKKIHMDSVSCIDNIHVYLLIEHGIITDAAFNGVACAISTSSTSIMTELLIGKSETDAMYIIDQYLAMINERKYDDSVLGEAIVFMNTHKQAARIKCATLGFIGAKTLLEEQHHHE
ncbi:MAG TPA: SUF system NifU family Fe-S cluster assembly protein [Bacilli bacterium]|nr:SUF system NifU family Fe-S cluster assembly protein [Bacilli bacterium]